MSNHFSAVMAGTSRPSTSFSLKARKKDVDARDKRGHDAGRDGRALLRKSPARHGRVDDRSARSQRWR
jgi:hypothetical protein